MKELVTEKELQQCGVSKEELLKRFSEQLQKDFEMSNLRKYVSEIKSLDIESLSAVIINALKHSSVQEEMQLLYRIDITETQIAKAMERSSNRDQKAVVADLIIRRVLQKVILKLIYSPK